MTGNANRRPAQASCREEVLCARLPPELVNARDAAHILGISPTFLEQLDASGRLGPQALRLGRRRLWSVEELRSWVRAGLPQREEWYTETPGCHRAQQEAVKYGPEITRRDPSRQG